jgi:hypothetical protein
MFALPALLIVSWTLLVTLVYLATSRTLSWPLAWLAVCVLGGVVCGLCTNLLFKHNDWVAKIHQDEHCFAGMELGLLANLGGGFLCLVSLGLSVLKARHARRS